MTKSSENWRRQAVADLYVIMDAIDELRDIYDRIAKALNEDNYELWRQAISDFTGVEEE